MARHGARGVGPSIPPKAVAAAEERVEMLCTNLQLSLCFSLLQKFAEAGAEDACLEDVSLHHPSVQSVFS